MVRTMLAGLPKSEARALQRGPEPVLPELHVGAGFDAEQVRGEGVWRERLSVGAVTQGMRVGTGFNAERGGVEVRVAPRISRQG